MTGGGADAPPPSNGGDFLLKLLQKPPQYQHQRSPPSPATETLPHDPAVAAIWPTFPFPPIPSHRPDLAYRPPFSHSPPPFAPHNFFVQGFPQNPNPIPNPNWSSSPQSQPQLPPGFNNTHPQFNQNSFGDESRKLGFLGATTHSRSNPSHLQEHNLIFGSLPPVIRNNEGVSNDHSYDNLASVAKVDTLLSKERDMVSGNNRRLNGLEVEFQSSRNQHQSSGTYRSAVSLPEVRRAPPPGFQSKPSVGNREFGNRRSRFESKVDKGKSNVGELNHRGFTSNHEDKRETRFLPGRNKRYGDMSAKQGLRGQLDTPGSPAGSNHPSVSASDIEESRLELHAEGGDIGEEHVGRMQNTMTRGRGQSEVDELEGHLMGSLVLEDESDDKNDRKKKRASRDKDYRSDKRGQWLLSQRMRISKSQIECRSDVNRLNAPFLAIYESLVPASEENEKQKQLLTLLEKLVSKEWPEARLYIYGSCANSFGFSKSDIDVCLLIEDTDVNKSEVLLKLADILESDSLQNVQALTRARVPIVKLMDPISGISCDICVNNVLAVVNTKLLHDYAQIDVRLRQLAFIVKHWAKSRGVNETYRGTLSSYAYVLMCIHFLQKRKPAILPCLQGMEKTYSATVDNIECTYFDQVERLHGFGSRNGESIALLVWAFFNYWAYCHDYANDVISVRTGSILSKQGKDWTRRIGNDRHLICIEDPFEVSHDLGRVVDKYTIRVLREEFERAAEIMQHDPNPCVRLFEPYVPA